jgi:hypothetical protein
MSVNQCFLATFQNSGNFSRPIDSLPVATLQSCKTTVYRLYFHFFFAVKNQIQLAKAQFRSLFVAVQKAKKQILPSKICEELSATQRFENQQILSNRKLIKSNRKRTVRQRFFTPQVCLFSFFTMTGNARGYGHLAVCGSIRCRETTKGMRAQNRWNARQPACAHRRVLWPVVSCRPVV